MYIWERIQRTISFIASSWKHGVISEYISEKFVCEILIIRAFRFRSSSMRRAAGPPLIIRHLDLYPAFFSRPITHNGAICVMFQLGRFRRTSAASGHASNTRSPTRDLAWTGSEPVRSLRREREPVAAAYLSYLPDLRVQTPPLFNLFDLPRPPYSAVFVCTCTHDFLPRGEEGKRKVERSSRQPEAEKGEV